MCEPYHSVVQYPHDFDDTDLPFGGQMNKEERLKAALGAAFSWTKKIEKWFHFSRFGAGHSKATMITGRNSIYLPKPTLYEGAWWRRTFHLDGWGAKAETRAFNAAEEYHHRSVMGNMSLFRRFLEQSMRQTTHGQGAFAYVDVLLQNVLTVEGGNQLLEKFRRVFGPSAHPCRVMSRRSHKQEVEKGIKIVMGFTRKRRLFLPHFADDNLLWVPGGQG